MGVGQEDEAECFFDDVEFLVEADGVDVGEALREFDEDFSGEGGGGFEDVVVDAEGEAFPLAGEVLGGGGHVGTVGRPPS